MEATKTFTVIDTRSNSKKFFESQAVTVGDLKRELANLGIDIEDIAIQEGLTHTEFKRDDEVLPTNVNYKGVTTNNLVFRLTKAEKKIDSGANLRAQLYEEIKENNLQDEIKETFGRNYTQVKTEDLEEFLSNFHCDEDAPLSTPAAPCVCAEPVGLTKALILLAEDLYKHNCISYDTYYTVTRLEEGKEPYSDKELNEMFL